MGRLVLRRARRLATKRINPLALKSPMEMSWHRNSSRWWRSTRRSFSWWSCTRHRAYRASLPSKIPIRSCRTTSWTEGMRSSWCPERGTTSFLPSGGQSSRRWWCCTSCTLRGGRLLSTPATTARPTSRPTTTAQFVTLVLRLIKSANIKYDDGSENEGRRKPVINGRRIYDPFLY